MSPEKRVTSFAENGTSSGGSISRRFATLVACSALACHATSSLAADPTTDFDLVFDAPTSSGTAVPFGLVDGGSGSNSASNGDEIAPPVDNRPACLKALIELRLTAGLTFDQAARLLGVSRRAVHLWVSRQRMSSTNEERLMRTLAVLRHADRGDAQSTRAALLQAAPDGRVPFDLIAEGKLDEARTLLGKGPGRKWLPYWPLSREEQEKRKPLPPWILMDARDDIVPKRVGRARGVRTHRTKRGNERA